MTEEESAADQEAEREMDEPSIRRYRSMTSRIIGITIIAALVLWIGVVSAFSAPPEGADPNSPTAQWYKSLTVPDSDAACCSLADCREVDYRMVGSHYEAFISKKSFGKDAPEQWLEVPEQSRIRPMTNPTGSGVACFYGGMIRCFVEATGT